jgi:hypothetical protein
MKHPREQRAHLDDAGRADPVGEFAVHVILHGRRIGGELAPPPRECEPRRSSVSLLRPALDVSGPLEVGEELPGGLLGDTRSLAEDGRTSPLHIEVREERDVRDAEGAMPTRMKARQRPASVEPVSEQQKPTQRLFVICNPVRS